MFGDMVDEISFWRVKTSFRRALMNVVILRGGLGVSKEMNTTSVFEI